MKISVYHTITILGKNWINYLIIWIVRVTYDESIHWNLMNGVYKLLVCLHFDHHVEALQKEFM